MCSVAACTSPRPTSARLSSNDTGCKWVIKHRNDVAQASFSLVPQRFTEVFSESGKMRPLYPHRALSVFTCWNTGMSTSFNKYFSNLVLQIGFK